MSSFKCRSCYQYLGELQDGYCVNCWPPTTSPAPIRDDGIGDKLDRIIELLEKRE